MGEEDFCKHMLLLAEEVLKLSSATELRESSRPALSSTFIPIETPQKAQEEVRKDFKSFFT